MAVVRGKPIPVPPRHDDCETAPKEVNLFVTDDVPKVVGVEGRHEGRRYIVTDEAIDVEGATLKPLWRVIGVWLDPES